MKHNEIGSVRKLHMQTMKEDRPSKSTKDLPNPLRKNKGNFVESMRERSMREASNPRDFDGGKKNL